MNLFIPIILIIISVGTFATYIHPKYQDIKELKQTQQEYKSKMSNAESIRKNRSKLATQKAELEKTDNLERLNKFLPDHINNIELIVDIDRIAKEDNIKISDISLVSDQSAKKENDGVIEISGSDKYESTNISFSFITNYNNFKNFVNNLRKSLRLLDISSVSFDAPSSEGDARINSNFTIKMTVRAYWLQNK